MQTNQYCLLFVACFLICCAQTVMAETTKHFIGSAQCGSCHIDEYKKFLTYSKKSKSWESIKIMASDLTQAEQEKCYRCHTTGYGQGGFKNYKETPELADVGCETCHGPGSKHAASGGDPAFIKKPTDKTCQKCHVQERVSAFRKRPILHAGAH